MSQFLGFPNALVPLGVSTLEVHNLWKTLLQAHGYQVKGEQVSTKPYALDVIPPASEPIGNADAYEFLRIFTNDNTVGFAPRKRWLRGYPQMVRISAATAGAVTITATLAGAVVSFAGSSGATATDNLMGLFAAIKASTNPAWTAYAWELSFPPPQNANDTAIYILGTKNAVTTADTITGTNVTAAVLAVPVPAGTDQPDATAPGAQTMPIDLVNGFIYYLQICSRGLALAIRTNAAYSGALHACWADHDKALAALPREAAYATPIELVVGVDDDATNCDGRGLVASPWLLPALTGTANLASSYNAGAPVSGRFLRGEIQDCVGSPNVYTYNPGVVGRSVQLLGSFLFTDADQVGNDFQVHRVGASGYTPIFTGSLSSPSPAEVIWPPFIVDDWYKFVGTAVDENLLVIADSVNTARLAAEVDATAITLPVDDLSVFQPSGFACIGNEFVQYAARSGASGAGQLTGCTRGTYGTQAARHYPGERISQGLWFVKINGSALLAGYVKPS